MAQFLECQMLPSAVARRLHYSDKISSKAMQVVINLNLLQDMVEAPLENPFGPIPCSRSIL
jgi:hypothetical protein